MRIREVPEVKTQIGYRAVALAGGALELFDTYTLQLEEWDALVAWVEANRS